LEADILKIGFEKPFFRISASKEPYLRGGDSRLIKMSKVQFFDKDEIINTAIFVVI